MSYFCHRCAVGLGYLQDVYTSSPLQSEYQLGKFVKHTLPSSQDFGSAFASTSARAYADYVVNTAASGAVELDPRGRRNILWIAGRLTGFVYDNGVLRGPTDGVKLVLSSDASKVHAFPVDTGGLRTKRCMSCDGLVATD